MTATNHALTGALIASLIREPLVAIPLAFVSHFVCDALPHFGPGKQIKGWLKSKKFAAMLALDGLLCILLVLVLAIAHPAHWFLMSLCAFVATSPDLLWMPGWLRERAGKQFRTAKQNLFMKFAKAIQWFEKPIGAYVEVAWAAGVVTLLVASLR